MLMIGAREYAKQRHVCIPLYSGCLRLQVAQERHEGVCGLDEKGGCPKAKNKRRNSGKEMVKDFFCFGS